MTIQPTDFSGARAAGAVQNLRHAAIRGDASKIRVLSGISDSCCGKGVFLILSAAKMLDQETRS
ncbi:hypothetical protein ACMV8I_00090 [Ewingella sp. S1.OA.A_B6]